MQCCADIYFNRQCQKQKLPPNHKKIKISITSPAAIFTQNKLTKMRIKDEIKFLYMKEQKINNELYSSHLKLAKEWSKYWYSIEESISESLNKEIEEKSKKNLMKNSKD